jgi:phosphoglycerol transferase MdoB-like AlkP superfamily enzyme
VEQFQHASGHPAFRFNPDLCYGIFCKKNAFLALFYLDLFISILLLIDITYMRYYGHSISFFLIYNIDFKFFSAVSDAITKLYEATDAVIFLDLPILAAIRFSTRKKSRFLHDARHQASLALLVTTLVLLVTLTFFIIQNYRSLPLMDNYAAKNLGVLNAHMDDFFQFVVHNPLAKEKLNDEEKLILAEFIKARKQRIPSSFYLGDYAGKNLLFVQVEALQNFVINQTVNRQEITPNLNKFIEGSYYFDNIYMQVAGGNTSDAEFLSNTAMYPIKTGSGYYTYADNTYASLPMTLKAQGYTTSAYHAFKPHFWNRDNMYTALGFDRFYSESDYTRDDFAGWDGHVLSDSTFFRQSVDFLSRKSPFYGFFVSVTSHFPFSAFNNYAFDTGVYNDSFLGNYLKAIHYEDQCLGELFQKLSDDGLLENTIVVVYGDHIAVPKYKSSELLRFLGKADNDYEWTKLQQVPVIMHLPGQKEGQRLDVTGGEIDIMPTIANLMDIRPFMLGQDLLNTDRGFALLRDGSVITDTYLYHAGSGMVYDTKTGSPLNLENYRQSIENYQKDLAVSDIIIRRNALRYDQDLKW